jgi:signal transduction histidine kinase
VRAKILRKTLTDRRFGPIVIGLIIAGFVFVLGAGTAALVVMMRGEEQTAAIKHTYQVERHVGGIRLALEEMRSARRGKLLGLAGNSGATYDEAKGRLDAEVAQVARLTLDNPRQQTNIARLGALSANLDGLFGASMLPGAQSDSQSERSRQDAAQRLERLAEDMAAEERALLKVREAAQQESVRTFYTVLGGTAVLLLLVGGASVLVILGYTRDLTRTRDQLRDLNANLEGAVGERTRDLQRANDEIQRFAYIVSHDLRSPLVNVMGFTAELEAALRPLSELIAEADERAPGLASSEAKLAVQEDLPEAIGFIRTSTQKMDRLINAILRLSREGRRTISPERIELTPLGNAIVGGIRHLIDDRGAAVEIQPDMPAITSDPFALEQILSNLIENALKYLKPGRPGLIRVTARRQAGRVLITVSDNGRGIDPRDHERIFDLFRRSGSQDQPGEGIGLAHARAQAYRLGGTISVASALDEGATFTIDFPEYFTPGHFTGQKGRLA